MHKSVIGQDGINEQKWPNGIHLFYTSLNKRASLCKDLFSSKINENHSHLQVKSMTHFSNFMRTTICSRWLSQAETLGLLYSHACLFYTDIFCILFVHFTMGFIFYLIFTSSRIAVGFAGIGCLLCIPRLYSYIPYITVLLPLLDRKAAVLSS